jgi:hypothetical protein
MALGSWRPRNNFKIPKWRLHVLVYVYVKRLQVYGVVGVYTHQTLGKGYHGFKSIYGNVRVLLSLIEKQKINVGNNRIFLNQGRKFFFFKIITHHYPWLLLAQSAAIFLMPQLCIK